MWKHPYSTKTSPTLYCSYSSLKARTPKIMSELKPWMHNCLKSIFLLLKQTSFKTCDDGHGYDSGCVMTIFNGFNTDACSVYVWSELFSGVLYFCVANTPVTEDYMDTYIAIRSLKEKSNLRVLFNWIPVELLPWSLLGSVCWIRAPFNIKTPQN